MAGITDIAGGLAGFGSANPYGRNSSGQWNLARGIYTRTDGKKIVFFYETYGSDEKKEKQQKTSVDQISDSGGRRIAVYEYPYRDGQRTRDLGRKGETLQFGIKFFGLDYQQKFKEFIDVVVNSNKSGTIIHPVRGAMSVRFKDYEYVHRFDEWNAVTIKATFIEETPDLSDLSTTIAKSTDAALRDGIQVLSDVQGFLTDAIGDANLVNVARQTLKTRLNSVVGQCSALVGNLVSTFSTDAKLTSLAAQGASVNGGLTQLSSGTTVSATGVQSTLPPLVQTGFDANTQSAIEAQTAAFVQASQVTTQQAVFQANQARQGILAAINEVEGMLGIESTDMILAYRQLATQLQESVEASISSAAAAVKTYTVLRPMSLRAVAFANGLNVDRQNDIEKLNPGIGSVNFVAAGTNLIIPVA